MGPSTGPDVIAQAKRLVIKIGSSLLIEHDPVQQNWQIRGAWLDSLITDVAALHAAGKDILLVSSGAIGLGRQTLGLPVGTLSLPQKQAASSVGQIQLTHAYQATLSKHDLIAAQILLTLDDSENRRRYINARNTLLTLLDKRSIPVINENDTVATSEIRVGDNDRLSARVAAMASADALILLSDVDGLYDSDPGHNPRARFLPHVAEITPEITAMAGAATTDVGTGGMITKLKAGRIANGAGCHMIICNGHMSHPLHHVQNGGRHTLFTAQSSPRAARKEWLASGLSSQGSITIDVGASQALMNGSSLLPAGINAVHGVFDRGDAVTIMDTTGQAIGRGLSAYPADELRLLMGTQSQNMATLIGYAGKAEAIHRDDLVLDDHWKQAYVDPNSSEEGPHDS